MSKKKQPSSPKNTLSNTRTVMNELIIMNEYSKITETQYYMNPNGLINNSFEEQVIYHKWVVAKKIPRNNRMANRFIEYVSKEIFKEIRVKKLSKEEEHAILNQKLLSIVPRQARDYEGNDAFRKWCGNITKIVMLVHYGFYKLDWDSGKLIDQSGEVLRKSDVIVRGEFREKLKIDTRLLKNMGDKHKREQTKVVLREGIEKSRST
jgi:hypothetical protein